MVLGILLEGREEGKLRLEAGHNRLCPTPLLEMATVKAPNRGGTEHGHLPVGWGQG